MLSCGDFQSLGATPCIIQVIRAFSDLKPMVTWGFTILRNPHIGEPIGNTEQEQKSWKTNDHCFEGFDL